MKALLAAPKRTIDKTVTDKTGLHLAECCSRSSSPLIHSSVLYTHPPDVWIPMWFERACAGADLQQYVVL